MEVPGPSMGGCWPWKAEAVLGLWAPWPSLGRRQAGKVEQEDLSIAPRVRNSEAYSQTSVNEGKGGGEVGGLATLVPRLAVEVLIGGGAQWH
jgi:hypothetical protein